MEIPVRCFSCGKVVGSSYHPFRDRVEEGEDPAEVMDDLGLERYCCRRMLLSHVDLVEQAARYG